MFSLLGTSQIYGVHEYNSNQNNNNNNNCTHHNISDAKIKYKNFAKNLIHINNTNHNNNTQFTVTPNKAARHSIHSSSHSPSSYGGSGSGSSSKFFASFGSMPSIKSPTNFIEKFIKNELLSSYDTIKNYKNFQNSTQASGSKSTFFTNNCDNSNTLNSTAATATATGAAVGGDFNNSTAEGLLANLNCLQGGGGSNCDGDCDADEFYEPVNVTLQRKTTAAATIKTTRTTTKARVKPAAKKQQSNTEADMTIKYSKNLLANPPDEESPATLQNYQKLSECEQDLLLSPSSGASSGEFNSDGNNAGSGSGRTATTSLSTPVNSLYKRLSFGGRGTAKSATENAAAAAGTTTARGTNENVTDYSSSNNSYSSASSTLSSSKTNNSIFPKSLDLKRSSSASSSGDCVQMRERRKCSPNAAEASKPANHLNAKSAETATSNASQQQLQQQLTPERAQRRKLISMISHYEQQNKLLQRELAKEKRRRNEELACVAKSLLCFESKLKKDMKAVNMRLLERDAEICRLVQQNRALRKRLVKISEAEGENARDEGVVEDGGEPETEPEGEEERSGGKLNETVLERGGTAPTMATTTTTTYSDQQMLELDCLVLEALQCINCKKQFYDIDLSESCWTKNAPKDGTRKNVDHTTEHGSSSDDTVSSSFYGARRSVRYTSKRTSGTFRDYMRSRAMNIDDPALEHNSEEYMSTISRDDSQNSYEKLNIYSRTIERMHGVKGESERESEQSGMEGNQVRPSSRLSCKSNGSSGKSEMSKAAKAAASQIEEDDGIFSPTQDDDFDEAEVEVESRAAAADGERSIKFVVRRSTDFSEASPKQIYETSTDDWYASASDQEENAPTAVANKSYAQGAVNPVLECVNQILLQQSMEEPVAERAANEAGKSSATHNPSTLAYTNFVPATTANLPRRSSLSGRRSSRSNSRSSDGQPSNTGTLTRKRVHFSTQNSMVHVPRNDEEDEDEDDDDASALSTTQDSNDTLISSFTQYHPMSYYPQATQQAMMSTKTTAATAAAAGTISRGGMLAEVSEHERLETLNYESIYSNEYEPIGSEHNSSNLYVDMDASTGKTSTNPHSHATLGATLGSLVEKVPKIPPALPPKPANLLKFKKSLQQLDEMPDEHLHQDEQTTTTTTTTIEPDYCSISEVNVGITCVQTVADIHKAPESEADMDASSVHESTISELDVEVSTVASDDTFAASQKTDEIEEIFADVPKLPNVAAIIAPKQAHHKFPQKPLHHHHQQQQTIAVKCSAASLSAAANDYLVMSPKVVQNARSANILQTNSATNKQPQTASSISSPSPKVLANTSKPSGDYLNTPLKSPNHRPDTNPLKLHLPMPSTLQYKRKHMPNILAEINKRMSLPNSPTTPTTPTARMTFATPTKSSTPSMASKTPTTPQKLEVSPLPNMPLQAEFDWYNLDAEYGKTALQLQQPDLLKVNDTLGGSGGSMLAGIHEDGESIATTADEYNLDEEFSLANDKPDVLAADGDGEESGENRRESGENRKESGENRTESGENETSEISEPTSQKSQPTPPATTTLQKTEHTKSNELKAICKVVNFPMFGESTPLIAPPPALTQQKDKVKKMQKNLASFEKFIEGSGLSTKPLPTKRKIYFAGPFV